MLAEGGGLGGDYLSCSVLFILFLLSRRAQARQRVGGRCYTKRWISSGSKQRPPQQQPQPTPPPPPRPALAGRRATTGVSPGSARNASPEAAATAQTALAGSSTREDLARAGPDTDTDTSKAPSPLSRGAGGGSSASGSGAQGQGKRRGGARLEVGTENAGGERASAREAMEVDDEVQVVGVVQGVPPPIPDKMVSEVEGRESDGNGNTEWNGMEWIEAE